MISNEVAGLAVLAVMLVAFLISLWLDLHANRSRRAPRKIA